MILIAKCNPLVHDGSPWSMPPEWVRLWKIEARKNRDAAKTPRRG